MGNEIDYGTTYEERVQIAENRCRELEVENERLRKVVEITKDLIACTANCQDCTASGSENCERFVAARSIATISGLKKDGDK